MACVYHIIGIGRDQRQRNVGLFVHQFNKDFTYKIYIFF